MATFKIDNISVDLWLDGSPKWCHLSERDDERSALSLSNNQVRELSIILGLAADRIDEKRKQEAKHYEKR